MITQHNLDHGNKCKKLNVSTSTNFTMSLKYWSWIHIYTKDNKTGVLGATFPSCRFPSLTKNFGAESRINMLFHPFHCQISTFSYFLMRAL